MDTASSGTIVNSKAVIYSSAGQVAATSVNVNQGATVGGTLEVTGATTLTGALDANNTGDFADTLTCSKVSGTGLSVTADARVQGATYLKDTSVDGLFSATGSSTFYNNAEINKH